jgi:hypothetical protein
MSGLIRKALFSNLSLKVVSLVLAVAIYLLVRPASTGRTARPDRHPAPATAAWKPDAGARSPDGSPDPDSARERDIRIRGQEASAPAREPPASAPAAP